jgi:transposase
MDIRRERVAGLDVHKAMIVACVRRVAGRTVDRKCRTFGTTTTDLLELLA